MDASTPFEDAGEDASVVDASTPPPQEPSAWWDAGRLSSPRSSHTATALEGGWVLLVGGRTGTGALRADAELFNPETGVSVDAGGLRSVRWGHVASATPNGWVAVSGGRRTDGTDSGTTEVDVFRPELFAFTPFNDLAQPRYDFSQERWVDGAGQQHALSVGGSNPLGLSPSDSCEHSFGTASGLNWSAPVQSALTNTFFKGSTVQHPDGGIWLLGGNTALVRAWRGSGLSWGALPSLSQDRFDHTATALEDGRVLVVGGRKPGAPGGTVGTYELYSFDGGSPSALPAKAAERARHFAVRLPSGEVLVLGGFWQPELEDGGVAPAEPVLETWRFLPRTNEWVEAGALLAPAYQAGVAHLPSGDVLVCGGALAPGGANHDHCQRYGPE